jgi:membrane-bound serine protease (ClpP class)
VSLGVAFGVTMPFALLTILLMRLVLSSRLWKPSTGSEQLLGSPGEVTEPIVKQKDGDIFQGMVRMHGELWRAVSSEEIPAGAQVQVTRIEGLTLHVALSGQNTAKA